MQYYYRLIKTRDGVYYEYWQEASDWSAYADTTPVRHTLEEAQADLGKATADGNRSPANPAYAGRATAPIRQL